MCGGSCGNVRGRSDQRNSRSSSAGWAAPARFRAAHGTGGRSGPQPSLAVSGEWCGVWLRGRACLVDLSVDIWLVRRPLPTLSRSLCSGRSEPMPCCCLPRLPMCPADGSACANVVVVTRADGFCVLTSICGDLGALPCVVPATHAGRPAVPRPPETAFGFCCCTAAGLAVTGAPEPPASLPIALLA